MNLHRIVAFALLLGTQPALAAPPRAARDTWIHLSAPGFELLTNGSAKPARELLEQLQTFRNTLTQLMPNLVVEAPDPIQVLLFARHADLRPYLPLSKEGEPAEIGALYLGSRGGCSAFGDWIALSNDVVDEVPGVVFHEFAHFLIKQNMGDLPIWLNEGLAEYYSTFHLARGRKVEIGKPVVDHMRWLQSVPAPSLQRLLAVDAKSAEYNEESRQGSFYAKAWLLVHYLQVGSPKDEGALTRFVRLRGSGLDDTSAFERAAGRPLAALEQELLHYQRRAVMSFRVFDLPAAGQAEGAALRAATTAEALYRLGIFLTRLGPNRVEDARAHFSAIRAVAPAAALADLGEAESMIFWGEAAQAVPLLRRARSADSTSVAARRLLAGALVRSEQGGPMSTDAAREAKAALEEALTLDGSRREDWRLYRLLLSPGQFAPSELLAAGERLHAALRRFPRDFELSLGAVHLYHQAEDFERAATLALATAAEAPPDRRAEFERAVFTASMASANGLARAGGPEGVAAGRQLLVTRLEALRDPAVQTMMTQALAAFDKSEKDRRLVDRHNEAVNLINTGKYREALAILQEILRSEPEPQVEAATKSILAKLEDYLARTKRKK